MENMALIVDVLDDIDEGIVVHAVGGAIEWANSTAQRILGLTLDELTGRTSIDPRWRAVRVDGSDWPGDSHPATVTLTTLTSVTNAIMGVHRPAGDLVWISLTSRPSFAENGSLRAVVVTCRDVTDFHRWWEHLTPTEAHLSPQFVRSPIAMCLSEFDGDVLVANDAFCDLMGRSRADCIGHGLHRFTHPDDVRASVHQRERLLDGDIPSLSVVERYMRPDGTERLGLVFATMTDVGCSRQMFVQIIDLIGDHRRDSGVDGDVIGHRTLATFALVGIIHVDPSGDITFVNDRCRALFAVESSMLPSRCRDAGLTRLHPDDRAEVVAAWDRALESGSAFEVSARLLIPSGRPRWIRLQAGPLTDPDGDFAGFVGIVHDVTEERLDAERLSWRASRDPLTGLGNRTFLSERANGALGAADQEVALMLLNLDGFKTTNDAFGHVAGDVVLMTIADRLGALVDDEDVLARIAGDEFAILLIGSDRVAALERLVIDCEASAALPIDTESGPVGNTFTVGAARGRGGESSLDELLRQADAEVTTRRAQLG